jgi:hypothetical protein
MAPRDERREASGELAAGPAGRSEAPAPEVPVDRGGPPLPPRRRRRWPLWASVLGAVALAAGLWVVLELAQVRVAMAEHQAEIERLRRESVASNRAAELLLAEGRHELVILASTRLLVAAARELGGYEQLTRKGNRFTIRDVDVHAEDGWLELVAQATFDWRWGLYDGPIEVRYLAFAGLQRDGSGVLHFRVADVRTLEHRRLFQSFLAPILTLRMQRQLRLPDLRLPLAVGGSEGGGEVAAGRANAQPRERAVRLRYRPGGWQLGAQNPRLLLNPRAFGLVVETLDPGRPNRLDVLPVPPHARLLDLDPLGEKDVRIGVRFDRLAALLRALFAPEDEVDLEIAQLAVPLEKTTSRLLGVEFARSFTLRDLRGLIDVELERVFLAGDHAEVAASFHGRFAGVVEGSMVGVDFAVPIKLRPELRQTLPLRFVGDQGELGIFVAADELALDLDVEARVQGRTIAFRYPLALPAVSLLRPLRLADMAGASIAVPTRVERGEIVERRPLPYAIDWTFTVPLREEETLEARGRVRFGSAADELLAGARPGASASAATQAVGTGSQPDDAGSPSPRR